VRRHQTLSSLLAVVSLALASLVVAAPSASPAPMAVAIGSPAGLTPSGSTTGPVPVLAWAAVGGAVRYDVQAAASSDFTSLLYGVSTTNIRATPTRALPGGDAFWRVRAIDRNGAAGAWSTAAFRVGAAVAPTQLSPANGAALQPPGDVPLLQWSDVAAADSYEVTVDNEAGFVSPETYTTRTTTLVRTLAQIPGTTYYWRVRALVDGQAGQWTPTRSWKVGGLGFPQLVAPANSSTATIEDVVLQWTGVAGASSYDVRVGTDSAFSTVVDSANTVSTRYSPPATLDNDQYWWQVRPVDSHGNFVDWSSPGVQTWQFQRSWQRAPTPEWPLDGATSVVAPMFYQWAPIPLASRYQLDVSNDRNFSPGFRSCFTTLTTFTAAGSSCMPTPGTATYWRVRAIDAPADVNSLFSPVQVFTYDTGQVQQLLPAHAATVDVPSLTWSPLPQAERYVVHLRRPDGTVSQFSTSSRSFTPEARLPAGSYGWQVQAEFSDGRSTQLLRGFTRTFTVSGDVPALATAPDPITPAPAATSFRAPALTWTSTAGATHYRVVISGPDTATAYRDMQGRWTYPAATDQGTERFAAGTYTWFVEAFANDGPAFAVGTTSTFVITEPAPVSGHAVGLSGRGLDSAGHRCVAALDAPAGSPTLCGNLRATPILDWQPVRDAAHYLLYISRDRSMTNRLSEYDGVRVNGTRWAPTSTLPDSQAGDAYYWAIRPCVGAGACAPEPSRAGHAFDKRSFPVSGLAPGAPVGATPTPVSGQVTLSWDEYRSTASDPANIDAATAELSDQGARQYHVQVATDPTFRSVIDSSYVDQTTHTSARSTYPEGVLYWRVRAVDGSGTDLPWSVVQAISKRTPGPVPVSPLDGATIGSAQVLRWQPEAGVSRYQVQVYKNDDRLFSPENLVRSTSSTFAATSFDEPLPASVQPYVWRVQRIDAGGNASQWSSARSFRVAAALLVLGSPATGYQPANALLFFWQPVTGASGYRVERRRADGAVDDHTITGGTAWAPTSSLPDGSYTWRVVAVDTSNQNLVASTWRAFKVDATTPVASATPVGTIKLNQNLVVRFSEPVTGVSTGSVKLFQKGGLQALATTVQVAADRRSAIVDPAALLVAGRTYTLKLLTGIRDVAGNRLPATSFTVVAQR
jgi:hypothetical protein